MEVVLERLDLALHVAVAGAELALEVRDLRLLLFAELLQGGLVGSLLLAELLLKALDLSFDGGGL